MYNIIPIYRKGLYITIFLLYIGKVFVIIMSDIIYTKISIPKDMISMIRDFRKKYPEFGYTSNVDFIKDAIRDKISLYNEQPIKNEVEA
jgi:hypothetical protein